MLRIVVLYNRLRGDPDIDMVPTTFLFAGKAAPRTALPSSSSSSLTTLRKRSTGTPPCEGGSRSFFSPSTAFRWQRS